MKVIQTLVRDLPESLSPLETAAAVVSTLTVDQLRLVVADWLQSQFGDETMQLMRFLIRDLPQTSSLLDSAEAFLHVLTTDHLRQLVAYWLELRVAISHSP